MKNLLFIVFMLFSLCGYSQPEVELGNDGVKYVVGSTDNYRYDMTIQFRGDKLIVEGGYYEIISGGIKVISDFYNGKYDYSLVSYKRSDFLVGVSYGSKYQIQILDGHNPFTLYLHYYKGNLIEVEINDPELAEPLVLLCKECN